MKNSFLIVLLVVTAGCATAITPQGAAVALVDRQADHKCSFVGTVTGSNAFGSDAAHDAEGALNEVRNKAAQMGANAVRIIHVNTNAEGTTVVGESLKCQF